LKFFLIQLFINIITPRIRQRYSCRGVVWAPTIWCSFAHFWLSCASWTSTDPWSS